MTTERTPEWYAQRRTGICGSDAAAVLGESHWKTPYDIWRSKVYDEPEKDSEVMYWGRKQEDMIREEYEKQTGFTVTQPGFARLESNPIICGNVDGLTEDRVVEIKTAQYEWDDDNVPKEYYIQCQHYMLLHGKQRADIAVLFHGNKFKIYELEADAELQALLPVVYEDFWERVELQTPPDLTTLSDVKKHYPFDNGNADTLSPEALRRLQELRDCKAKIAELEEVIGTDELFIKEEMCENQAGLDEEGNVVVTWKTSKPRQVVDTKELEKQFPNIVMQFKHDATPSRPFVIKEPKKKK